MTYIFRYLLKIQLKPVKTTCLFWLLKDFVRKFSYC